MNDNQLFFRAVLGFLDEKEDEKVVDYLKKNNLTLLVWILDDTEFECWLIEPEENKEHATYWNWEKYPTLKAGQILHLKDNRFYHKLVKEYGNDWKHSLRWKKISIEESIVN